MSSRNFIWKLEWDTSADLWELWKYKISLYSCRKLGACHLSQRSQSGVHTAIPIGALSQARQLTNPQAIPWKLKNRLHDPFFFSPCEGVLGVGDILLILTNLPECLLCFFLALCFSGVLLPIFWFPVFSQRKLGLYVLVSMEEWRLRDS